MKKGKVTTEDLQINGFDLTKYKEHPRVVELRVIALFSILADEYGVEEATQYFQTLCKMMKVDWAKMSAIMNSYFNIRRLERIDLRRYRQELILMGMLWGETRWYVAQYYLKITHTTLYTKKNMLNPTDYVTPAWLDELANNTVICGQETYKIEALRFLEKMEHFMELMGNVSVSG